MKLLGEINREYGGGGVVGDALENFGEVGDPEGGLEAGANFFEALCEGQIFLFGRGGESPATGADCSGSDAFYGVKSDFRRVLKPRKFLQ